MAITKVDAQQRIRPAVGASEIALQPDVRPITTTEDIIRELVAQGVPIEKIRIPGKGKKDILFVADDFNAPLEDFED